MSLNIVQARHAPFGEGTLQGDDIPRCGRASIKCKVM
ncbi:hypothetical protein ANRL2_01017 [Anaerolineae bacterium]|nr:hypothetical protein ANRL2_01017 [Anaerolineae bacterium]